jgi:putative FmdB family regulatory protein
MFTVVDEFVECPNNPRKLTPTNPASKITSHMPLYEYLCKKCGHRFEEIRKFSDKQPTKCPKCGGVIEQVISAPAVQFKGSGWYVTDYAKKGSASASSGSTSSEGDSSSKDAKDSKDTKEGKEAKESKKDDKKDDKRKSDTSPRKNKKD